MLQISQIENPRCSAKIDQIKFRRAINLPFDSQNLWSSGFQSEIQLVPIAIMAFSRSRQSQMAPQGRPRKRCANAMTRENRRISPLQEMDNARFGGATT